ADIRVAGVEQDDRRGPESVGEEQPERGRVDERQVQVWITEAGVELHRNGLAPGLLDGDHDEVVEEGFRLDPDLAGAARALRYLGERAGCIVTPDVRDMETGSIRDHGLYANHAARCAGGERCQRSVDEGA